MGVVYLARDPLIGRLVALKTFHSGYSEEDQELQEFRARFLREAQSAGILNHPAIVTIHDVVDSSDEEGATFIAMEYVQGTNLKERLRSVGNLDLRRASAIVLQIADALDYAHGCGVVHRDIKPANIILTRDGDPKITDFGIARLDTSDLTQEGQLLGTPNYMAPERILGQEVDHRTDIFSLGVLFYEMLTCHKPFKGDNLTMVTHRIVYDPFTPPEQYEPSIPPEIVAILERAMRKEPAERYERAGDMAEELRGLIDGLPTDTGPRENLSATQDVSGQLAREAVDQAIEDATRTDGNDTAAMKVLSHVETTASWRTRAARTGVVALLLAGLAGLAWWGVRWTQPGIERSSQSTLEQAQYLPMLRAARRHLDQGRPDLAQGHIDRALSVAPQAAPVLSLQRKIEDAVAAAAAAEEERRRLALHDEAATALAAGRLNEAETALNELLEEAPEDETTLALQEQLEAERQRAEAARRAAAAATPPPVAEESEEASEDATPVAAAEFPLAITFFTEISRGEMRLWINDRLILNETFKFVEKVGLFKTIDRHGRFDAQIDVATGPVKVKVEVDPRGGKAVVGHFADQVEGGEPRVLEIRFDAAARLAIGLRTGDPIPLE